MRFRRVQKSRPIRLVPGPNACCAEGSGQGEAGRLGIRPKTNAGRARLDQRKNEIGSGPGLVLNVLNKDRFDAVRTEQTLIIEIARL